MSLTKPSRAEDEARELLETMVRKEITRRNLSPEDLAKHLSIFPSGAMTLLKQTSLATLVTVPEMALLPQRIFSNNFTFVEPILALTMIFLGMTTMLLIAQQVLERAFRLKV